MKFGKFTVSKINQPETILPRAIYAHLDAPMFRQYYVSNLVSLRMNNTDKINQPEAILPRAIYAHLDAPMFRQYYISNLVSLRMNNTDKKICYSETLPCFFIKRRVPRFNPGGRQQLQQATKLLASPPASPLVHDPQL
jgi:hypothetical protein